MSIIRLRPHTEIPLVLDCLRRRGAQRLPAYRTLQSMWRREASSLDVHPSITPQDMGAFASLMYELEEPIDIEVSSEDLWHIHGSFDWFQGTVRPECAMTAGVMEILSEAVGNLPVPPG